MTPIKVGDYEVEAFSAINEDGPQTWYVVRPIDDFGLVEHETYLRAEDGLMSRLRIDKFSTLPMALRVAAELAGIERQRVEVYRYPPFIGGYGNTLMTNSPNGLDYYETFDRTDVDELNECGDMAHEFARERYASLGGAA